jgi:ketosteroid isomerase-like protein
MKKISLLPVLFFSMVAFSQSSDELTIRKVLDNQIKAWNKGDIGGFMQGYWKNDSLMFIGKKGIIWGWQTTLENYKKNYPDTTAMGKLSFDIILVKKLSPDYYYIVGKWMLSRSIGDLSGHYNLLFKKINGTWLIVADHSS